MVYILMRRAATGLLLVVVLALAAARPDGIHFLRWPEMQPVLAELASTGEKLSTFADEKEWDAWIRARDAEIRARVDRGADDSISAWILFGTSFTSQPRIASAPEAVNPAGDLTGNARARVTSFLAGLDSQDSERFRVVLELLRRQRISQEEVEAFLTGNLRRYALEQAGARRTSKNMPREQGSLLPDIAWPANFAIQEALRGLKGKGVPARIRRAAVVGPGLDFAGDPDCADFNAPQSPQPFALLDSILQLGLAQAADAEITAFDIHPWVLAHLRGIKGKTAQKYVLQFPRKKSAAWNAGLTSYWQHFGDAIGTTAPAAEAPSGYEVRAIAVKPQLAARLKVEDLDVVAQTSEGAPDKGFDLVVATNVLGSYNRVEQTLALASMGQMLAGGGLLLVDGAPPDLKTPQLELIGVQHVVFTEGGAGDDVVAYRKRP